MSTFGKRLKKAMSDADMRQSELAEITGISKGALSSYVSGRYEPKREYTAKIAKALNVDERWLMGYDSECEIAKEDTLMLQEDAIKKAVGNAITQILKEKEEQYYINDEVQQIAQEIHDDPNLRILFSASRKLSAEDVKFVVDMVERLKKG